VALAAPPQTFYARNGSSHIAYQVLGEGDVDFLITSHVNISVDAFDREPHLARFMESVARFARIIRFDERGIGLSDPFSLDELPTLEQSAEDALAVLDDAGSRAVALFGTLWSGPMMMLLAATLPERVRALVLHTTSARFMVAPDYPEGVTEATVARLAPDQGTSDDASSPFVHAPSLAGDSLFESWWDEEGRRGASPATAHALWTLRSTIDARGILAAIRVPTLVFHRPIGRFGPGFGRYLAEHIPGARLIGLAGSDTYPFAEDVETLLDEISELLTGSRAEHRCSQALTTIIFTDIVGSTLHVVRMGDRRWRDILERHDSMAQRQVERFGCQRVHSIGLGDGVLVTSNGPARAVRCAAAICEGAAQLGVDVRAGVHTGEVERRGDDIVGIALHIGRRVCDAAGSGQVLVSSAVPPLTIGSGIAFVDAGEHELKGVPGGPFRLFSMAK
jgi:class 3 adenylate cyclase